MGIFGSDLNSIEGINKIKIPKYKAIADIKSPTNNIEYILQRKATQHKKDGRMDLAIACLRKSNEIMRVSNFQYTMTDYLRLPSYLTRAGQTTEALEVLNAFEKWDLSITDRARLYAHIAHLLIQMGRQNEAVFYRAANHIYITINLENLHKSAIQNRQSKAEIASLARLLREHKKDIHTAFKDVSPKVTSFISTFPLQNFSETTFQGKLRSYLSP